MKKSVKFIIAFLIICIFFSVSFAAFIIYMDPFFHYHKPHPREGKGYIMEDQRYINDGIVKNFDYDAMICGSSMTETFRTSVMDEEFKTTSVKVPFSGGSYKEVGELVTTACEYNPDLKIVVRALDGNRFFNDKDERDYEADHYPTYLYDKNLLNDVNYIFSKDALLTAVQDFLGKGAASKPISFDEYSNWNNSYQFGVSAVNANYARNTVIPATSQDPLTEEDKAIILGNITQNVTDIADANPDVEFYIYYTPYSIYYVDYFRLLGQFDRQFEAEKYITSLLLEHKNIHVYSFYMQHDYIEDANNYRDVAHHGQAMSDEIIRWLASGEGELTKDNYEAYYEEMYDYYTKLDYDSFFVDWK